MENVVGENEGQRDRQTDGINNRGWLFQRDLREGRGVDDLS